MIRTRQDIHGIAHKVHLGGWNRQSTDVRDEPYRLKLPHGFLAAAPTAIDLRSGCSPVEDQGDLGSCTANMFAGMIEYNEIKGGFTKLSGFKLPAAANASVAVSNIQVSPTGVITFTTTVTPPTPVPIPVPTPTPTPTKKLIQVSRLFEYYATRKIEGTVSEDSGATIRDTIKAGAQYGVADEAAWPYNIAQFAVNPPASIWTAAAGHKIVSYHSITDGDITTMKAAIAAGSPVGYGFQVYDYFLSQAMATKGFLPLPTSSESLQGGHAQVLVGYDDNMVNPFDSTDKGAFLVRNSWGSAWGLQGYYYVTYKYIKNTSLCSDFWVVITEPY
jgi:C1A family cysteine protease